MFITGSTGFPVPSPGPLVSLLMGSGGKGAATDECWPDPNADGAFGAEVDDDDEMELMREAALGS